jgi:predicted MFS family arabinose efflux permease
MPEDPKVEPILTEVRNTLPSTRPTLDAPEIAAAAAKIDGTIERRQAEPSKTIADPIAAMLSIIFGMLSASGLPSTLGISTTMLMATGGIVVALAALGRSVWHWRRGEAVALQDKIAAFLGAIVAAATAGGLPVNQISPDLVGAAAATLATIFTTRRAVKKSE